MPQLPCRATKSTSTELLATTSSSNPRDSPPDDPRISSAVPRLVITVRFNFQLSDFQIPFQRSI